MKLRAFSAVMLAIGATHASGGETLAAQGPATQTTAVQATTTPSPASAPPTSLGTDAGIAPFSAHYQADWKTINVGTSDLELQQDTEPGHYVYTWTTTARGVFRLVYSDDVIQKSWFKVNANHVHPEKYHAEEGSSSVNLDFDWDSGHARGVSEKKVVDLKLKEGTQDVMSIQVEVMLDLQKGDLPRNFQIVDKDELKEFIYAREGTAKIRTALGELDTIVVSSQRTGGNRILRMWFAPSLGFVPVQAERTRDGKLEFSMRIKSLKR